MRVRKQIEFRQHEVVRGKKKSAQIANEIKITRDNKIMSINASNNKQENVVASQIKTSTCTETHATQHANITNAKVSRIPGEKKVEKIG